ncbi:hypothetical protein EDEG_03213 [Edhazardia aedis USNM 41457]|uniref:Vacuolar import/degradation Vid27 C-terminal domain-containing protein n=1 Tax=Edhazardia aedis (strain USNM 41457) TaxID=1003232 RepID=J9D474_EDHAE|nr:hypothetical protein EDEG_03213 [Edhazardia aedis USNM 41457]|eukprot:EJW02354.1 hypothetical protein EDEG_03213 [Edhazardia aedis USNM 41457]
MQSSFIENLHEIDERPHRFSRIFDADIYDSKEDLSRLFESDSDPEQQNKTLSVGTNNNVIVNKGKDINIYTLNSNINGTKTNSLLYRGCISTPNDVQKILPHDNSILIIDKINPQAVSAIDLQTGKISQKWDLNLDVKDCFSGTKNIGNETKYDPTIIGLNSNTIFKLDTRMKDSVVDKNTYKTDTKFKTGMATKTGDMAICSENGELRLYSFSQGIPKRAKNLLKGHNDKLVGMDITGNKKYAICTYKTYILFYQVQSAYTQTLRKEDKDRVPKKLCLKPEHVPYINEEISFTTAKFSTDENEEFIVASTGHFVISWNLCDVLSDNLYNYSIKKCNDKVVADEFGFNCSDKIVVALKDDVKMVDKNKLKNVDNVVKKRCEESSVHSSYVYDNEQ